MTRILVTGASGFIGAALARRLVERGDDVHLWTRPGSDGWRLRGLEARARDVDLREPADVARALARAKPEWIFHLAAHGAYPDQTDWRRMVATNVLGLRNLLDSALALGVGTLVQAGSSSEYGFTDHAPDEDEPPRPNSDYAATKAAATRLCRLFSRGRGLRAVTLRLYSVYGPWEEPRRFVPRLAVEGLSGRLPPLVSPDVARDFVYVDDVVEAFLQVASAPRVPEGAIYNVGTGRQVTIRDAVEVSRRHFGIEEGPRFSTMPGRTWDTDTWVANPARLERELGFRPRTSFEQGFARFTDWLRAEPVILKRYRVSDAGKGHDGTAG